jgi:pyruvate dehydrogenase E2 component (dihydrolipoamide acetyltransferase)
VRKQSLAPLRVRRLALIAAASDQADEPAALSLRLLAGGDIRPVTMPLLPGRAMRLVLVVDGDAECLLSFDAALVDEDTATAFLLRFKAYLEVPLRLLA